MPSLRRIPSQALAKLLKSRNKNGSENTSGSSTPSQRSSSNPLPTSFGNSTRPRDSILSARTVSNSSNPANALSDMKLGDAPLPREKHQKITPQELRELRELIILRYTLDIELYTLRDAKSFGRDDVEDKIRNADAALAKIKRTTKDWDRKDFWENEGDYLKWKEIKRRIAEPGKREWCKNPPWNDRRS